MTKETNKTETTGGWSDLTKALIETLSSLIKSAGAWVSQKFFSTKVEDACDKPEKTIDSETEEVKEAE